MNRYVVCASNEGYPASLEVGKVYRVLPDTDADKNGEIRVIDEEGEDYVYPRSIFEPVTISTRVQHAIARRQTV
jgi:hypothetical protein